jgi:hypothetical protein
MNNRIFVYGTIAGLVIIVINTLSFELGIGHAWLGFLVMFIAFSVIFVAVKQHRDQVLGGVIRFGTGFSLGLGITAIASLVYVLVWELYLAMTDHAFVEAYVAYLQQAAAAAQTDPAVTLAQTDAFRAQYGNPLYRLPMTFVEIFPVGLLVSLISAWVLKNSKTMAAQ